jgi:Holliday junction resolvase
LRTKFSVQGKSPKEYTEADILKACKRHLKAQGYYVIRNQLGLGAHKGLSDLQAIKDGLTVYIECKSPKWRGKLNPDQVEFKREIEEHGGMFILIDQMDQVEGL